MVIEEGNLTFEQIKMTRCSIYTLFKKKFYSILKICKIIWGFIKIELLVILKKNQPKFQFTKNIRYLSSIVFEYSI